jgi:hypothetical protein
VPDQFLPYRQIIGAIYRLTKNPAAAETGLQGCTMAIYTPNKTIRAKTQTAFGNY